MRYLQSYHIKDIKKYCQLQCQRIMINKSFEEDITLNRGLWSGYIFGIKICNKVILSGDYYNKHTLYYYFKKQQNRYKHNKGISQALYDILTYISTIDERF